LKFSVITVCLNNASTINRTIESVLSQTYKNIEYIIIDGASSDNTLSLVYDYSYRISKVISEPDKGIYDAMNKGIALATGDVVSFLNADDYYASSDVIEKVASAFTASGAACCYGDIYYVEQSNTSKIVRYWKTSKFKIGSFQYGWCPPHSAFFVLRSVIHRWGGFDLNYKIAGDFELILRYLEVAKISNYYISDVLTIMRLGGVSNRNIINIIKQNIEIYKALSTNILNVNLISFSINKLVIKIYQFINRPSL